MKPEKVVEEKIVYKEVVNNDEVRRLESEL